MVRLAGSRVLGAVVDAAGGRSRGCVGGVRRRRVLPSGGPAQTILRAESAKNLKKRNVKNKNRKKNKPPAPPPSILGDMCFAKWLGALAGALPNSRTWRLTCLSSWRPGAPYAGNNISRMQTKGPQRRHTNTISALRVSSPACSTRTAKRARACRGASNACHAKFRRRVSEAASVVAMGHRAAGRSMRWMEVDCNRILVPRLPVNMASRLDFMQTALKEDANVALK